MKQMKKSCPTTTAGGDAGNGQCWPADWPQMPSLWALALWAVWRASTPPFSPFWPHIHDISSYTIFVDIFTFLHLRIFHFPKLPKLPKCRSFFIAINILKVLYFFLQINFIQFPPISFIHHLLLPLFPLAAGQIFAHRDWQNPREIGNGVCCWAIPGERVPGEGRALKSHGNGDFHHDCRGPKVHKIE
jgi:hypothetical protein